MVSSENNLQRFVREFREDFLQVFVLLLIVTLVQDKPIDLFRLLRLSIVISIVTASLALFNSDAVKKVREGMTSKFGASLLDVA